jgi:cytochrome P450
MSAVPKLPATLPEAPTRGPLQLAAMLWRMRGDPLMSLVDEVRDEPVGQARLPGFPMHTIHRPAHVEQVLLTNHENYVKGPDYDLFGTALGQGLLTSRGELWRRQRQLVQPLFAKRHVAAFAPAMTGATERLLGEWDALPGERPRVDVAHAMGGLALDVVGRALFGAELTREVSDTVATSMSAILAELGGAGRSSLFWAAQTLPGVTVERALRLRPRRQRRFRGDVAALDAVVEELVARRRAPAGGAAATLAGEPDLLALLLGARDEATGQPMDARQVRDEVVTFLLAGYETTASALTWMWWLLAQAPAARERLHAEVDAVLGGRPAGFDDAERLPWTSAVVKEALRLYPPVWVLLRRAVEDDAIGGYRIPAGTTVFSILYLTHRDPETWPDPERFDPERFLPGRDAERPRCAFLPFSIGRRSCVGRAFALTETTVLAATIAQRYALDADPARPPVPDGTLTLRTRGGLPMTLRRRG